MESLVNDWPVVSRFKEHGVGYQFESGEIIRVDSQILHAEVVKPVLTLLGQEERFKGANEEFLKAHEHYRNGRYEECLVDALRSFESVMKAICHKQKWVYNQNDAAKKLIEISEKDLILIELNYMSINYYFKIKKNYNKKKLKNKNKSKIKN